MRTLFILAIALFISSCSGKKELADFIIYNGKICITDSMFTVHESMAVKDGKILATGTFDEMQSEYETQERINLEGSYVYPGFIDAHCHFLYFGLFMQRADLTGTEGMHEVLNRLKKFKEKNPDKKWLLGRGWDQNDWNTKEFPTSAELDVVFPDIPVYIERIDGHAALVNTVAARLAGLESIKDIRGGTIERKDGKLTGILIDNAMELVKKVMLVPPVEEKIRALKEAEAMCLSMGITSVHDAGLDKQDIYLIDSLHKSGDLKIRIYAMISDKKENLDHFLEKGPIKTPRLNVRSVKYYVDGALGSRGACLLSPYSDKPAESGFLLNIPEYFKEAAFVLESKGFQMNAHCIGDSANRLMLDIFKDVLKGKNNKRWRIEHAQVVSDADLPKFSAYSIIPSVQPVHATSDMYWTKERLGDRERTGYRYKDLLLSSGRIAIGTDFPVEHPSPFANFSAAVYRQDKNNNPSGGFLPENRLTSKEALIGMTIDAAYAAFEEDEKGSLHPGKFADFIVFDTDLLNADATAIRNTKVKFTYLNGKKVFQKP